MSSIGIALIGPEGRYLKAAVILNYCYCTKINTRGYYLLKQPLDYVRCGISGQVPFAWLPPHDQVTNAAANKIGLMAAIPQHFNDIKGSFGKQFSIEHFSKSLHEGEVKVKIKERFHERHFL